MNYEYESILATHMKDSSAALDEFRNDFAARSMVEAMGTRIGQAMRAGNKLLICGNGGSAADAQHIAAELVVRLGRYRRALSAISISADTSVITAAGNDLGFDWVFARQVEAMGMAGDILLTLSTSGRSKNVINAVASSAERGMVRMGMVGANGPENAHMMYDYLMYAPSKNTAIIQQIHMTAAHAMCMIIEREALSTS